MIYSNSQAFPVCVHNIYGWQSLKMRLIIPILTLPVLCRFLVPYRSLKLPYVEHPVLVQSKAVVSVWSVHKKLHVFTNTEKDRHDSHAASERMVSSICSRPYAMPHIAYM